MIRVAPRRLTFEPTAEVRLPRYPGHLWRSALGERLRRDACITGAEQCTGCIVRHRCAYGRLYEPVPGPAATGLAARFRDLPRPYILSPRHWGGRYGAGQPLELDVILLDGGIAEWPALQRAAERLNLYRTPLRLVDIQMLASPRNNAPVDDGTTDHSGFEPTPPPCPERARVYLEHPLRLRRDNRTVDTQDLTPGLFIGTLLRRLSSFYEAAGRPPPADFAGLTEYARQALRFQDAQLAWFDTERQSARQGRTVPMGGLLGSITLAGELEPVWPALWAGQWTHVGKGAVMGLGRYHLEPDSLASEAPTPDDDSAA